jgi:RNA polymerase sigma-70 factor (ECF subfamily)
MSEPVDPARPLDQISTHWTAVSKPDQFTLRYVQSVLAYLKALLGNEQDAEEVLQEFMLRVFEKGFQSASPERGRFRHYLKVSVRNAALAWLRQRRPEAVDVALLQDTVADRGSGPEKEMDDSWRRSLLDKAWRELDRHERSSPDNHAHTVLRIAAEHPEESAAAQAARVSALLGKELRPDAFRKQLSRARRRFAELVLIEVYQDLDTEDPAVVEEELIELRLMDYVRDFLPPDWHSGG